MAVIVDLKFFPVSVPYVRAEVSSLVHRLGVTDVLVRAVDEAGRVGWGESASGANTESIIEALRAMEPFVIGRSSWDSACIRSALWKAAIWQYRKPTASFAYAGIDMALWDLAGQECGQPIYRLFGGKLRDWVNYYYYVEQGSPERIYEQARRGSADGYTVFYLKVGIDVQAELEMVRALREGIGPRAKIRLDANGAWRVNEALRILEEFDCYRVDFMEQPVCQDPVSNMREVRSRSRVALCANEGMWSAEDAYRHITLRAADVYCFSPYWVGSLAEFQRLSYVAHCEGLQVCRHSHGELGIAAAAFHHVCLTLPNLVDGNQQTAQIMEDDILRSRLPIADFPDWGPIDAPGIGIEVDEAKVAQFHDHYRKIGQYLPYDQKITEMGRSQLATK